MGAPLTCDLSAVCHAQEEGEESTRGTNFATSAVLLTLRKKRSGAVHVPVLASNSEDTQVGLHGDSGSPSQLGVPVIVLTVITMESITHAI